MKKRFISIILISALLCSCSALASDSQSGKETESNPTSVSVSGTVELSNNADPFDEHKGFSTENYGSFYLLVKENPIDRDYNADPVDSTTLVMRKHENKYTEIWLDELEYSCDSFATLLTDEDRAEFESIQAEWKNSLDKDFSFVSKVLTGETYSVHMGSVFQFEQAYEYREAVRKRVLYIKYLQYSFEANGESSDEKVTVEFKYQSGAESGTQS